MMGTWFPDVVLRGTRARISAHVVWDYLVRPIPTELEEVPWCAEALSVEWLTALLCANFPRARVVSFNVSGGHEGTSVRRRIKVSYNEEGDRVGLPSSLFTKSTPTLATRLGIGQRVAATEVAFYRRVRPELKIEAPICHYAGSDAASARSLVVLDDLTASKQAQFCTWTTRISRTQADDIIDTLAALHVRYLASPHDRDLVGVPTVDKFFGAGWLSLPGIEQCHDEAMTRAEAVIPSDVLRRKKETLALAVRGLDIHGQHPHTLVHSDVHLGNWYITSDGRMGLCDWQCLSRGHWARDLAYAISTTLSIEDRREWERDLLARYLERIREGCDIEITFEETWDLYRQQLFGALLMWTPTLVHFPWLPDMQPEAMSMELIKRITAAISDLEAFDSYRVK
jgi:hypothetical protein